MSKSPSLAASVKRLPFYPALSGKIVKAWDGRAATMKSFLDAAQKQLNEVELPKVALYVSKAMKMAGKTPKATKAAGRKKAPKKSVAKAAKATKKSRK